MGIMAGVVPTIIIPAAAKVVAGRGGGSPTPEGTLFLIVSLGIVMVCMVGLALLSTRK